MTFGRSDGIEFKLTKNVVESHERWVGLGLLQPNFKEWFSIQTRAPHLSKRPDSSAKITI